MAFEKPSFTDMKGHAVTVMNFWVKEPALPKAKIPVQFPVELKNIRGYQVFLINGTSGIICKENVPRELIREQDADKPHSADAWAFILVHIVQEPRKLALQKLLFPNSAPYVYAVEAFLDWQEAVDNAVMQASSYAWSKKIIADMDARQNEKEEGHE